MRTLAWLLPLLISFPCSAEHELPGLKKPPYPADVCSQRDRVRELHEKVKAGGAISDDDKKFLRSAVQNVGSCPKEFTAEDTAALMHWLQILPCDPKTLKAPITITVFPEFHDKQPVGAYKAYFKKLENGEAFVAYETGLHLLAGLKIKNLPEKRRNGVVPASDGVLPVMAGILDSFNIVTSAGEQKKEFRADAKLYAPAIVAVLSQGGETAAKIFAKVEADLKMRDATTFAKLVPVLEFLRANAKDEAAVAKMAIDDDAHEKLVQDLLAQTKVDSVATLTKMLEPYVTAVVAQLHDEINEQHTQFRSHAPLVDKGVIGRFALQGPAVYIDWRDRNMAHSVLRLVCDAAKAGVTEVALHIGAGHLPGIYNILANTVKNDALEKSLLLRVDTSVTKLKEDLQEQDKEGAILKAFEKIPADRKFEFK